ncbi:hypothetical protein GW931_01455 [archaeon]|nr:hypothetical protein [archaeon]
MEIEPGDILICNVEKIVGTTVFVEIVGTKMPGTIILSEIAAGRIRNLRDYVVPKKTIICKVLRIMNDHIELSLRRVKEKEQKEVLEKNKLEKSYINILKSILKEKTSEIVEKIKEKAPLQEFLNLSKENPKELEKLIGKEDSKKVIDILKKQKEKVFYLKKEIKLTSTNPEGINLIKKILSNRKGVEVKYIAAGRYSLISEGENLKKTDQKIKEFIEEIEKECKKENMEMIVA